MKKQFLMFTAAAMLAAALAGCGQPTQKSSAQMGYIGVDAAKNMATTAAQVDTTNTTFTTATLGQKDGIAYYEVDFTANGTDYRYAIDAMTGAVIESNSAASQTAGTNGTIATAAANGTTAAGAANGTTAAGAANGTTSAGSANGSATTGQTGAIDEARAKQIALNHAGVSESDTTFVMAKQDYENGVLVYEIEFYVAATGSEYDYEIDAATGEIRGFDYDAENYTPMQQNTAAASGETLSEADVRSIALAKVPGATANDIRMYLDRDDGRLCYEGKIIYQGMEYDFEIDAYSGSIREWEAESVFD